MTFSDLFTVALSKGKGTFDEILYILSTFSCFSDVDYLWSVRKISFPSPVDLGIACQLTSLTFFTLPAFSKEQRSAFRLELYIFKMLLVSVCAFVCAWKVSNHFIKETLEHYFAFICITVKCWQFLLKHIGKRPGTSLNIYYI